MFWKIVLKFKEKRHNKKEYNLKRTKLLYIDMDNSYQRRCRRKT